MEARPDSPLLGQLHALHVRAQPRPPQVGQYGQGLRIREGRPGPVVVLAEHYPGPVRVIGECPQQEGEDRPQQPHLPWPVSKSPSLLSIALVPGWMGWFDGIPVAVGWLVLSGISILTLEYVNYIRHWGLRRSEDERFARSTHGTPRPAGPGGAFWS